jgi:hypothetical protein
MGKRLIAPTVGRKSHAHSVVIHGLATKNTVGVDGLSVPRRHSNVSVMIPGTTHPVVTRRAAMDGSCRRKSPIPSPHRSPTPTRGLTLRRKRPRTAGRRLRKAGVSSRPPKHLRAPRVRASPEASAARETQAGPAIQAAVETARGRVTRSNLGQAWLLFPATSSSTSSW